MKAQVHNPTHVLAQRTITDNVLPAAVRVTLCTHTLCLVVHRVKLSVKRLLHKINFSLYILWVLNASLHEKFDLVLFYLIWRVQRKSSAREEAQFSWLMVQKWKNSMPWERMIICISFRFICRWPWNSFSISLFVKQSLPIAKDGNME